MPSSVTIGALRYDIIADTEKFERTMTATAAEIRQQKKVFRETQTPAEKYGAAIDRLNNLRRKGLISSQQYSRALQREAEAYKQSTQGATRYTSSLTNIDSTIRSMAGPLLAIASAGGIGRMILGDLAVLDQLEVTADKLGVTANELTVMRLAAEDLSKMSATTFDMALQRMTRRVAEAAQGTGEAVKALDELGLSAEQLVGMGPSRAFREIADAMEDVNNKGDRLRLAFKLFDSEGAALVNVLGRGSEALDQFGEKAEALGLILDPEATQRVREANQAIREMQQSLRGLGREITVTAAPAIKGFSDAARVTIQDTREQLEEPLGVDFLTRIGIGGREAPLSRQMRLDRALAQATEGIDTGAQHAAWLNIGRTLGQSITEGMGEEIISWADTAGDLWEEWGERGIRAAEKIEAAAVKARKEEQERQRQEDERIMKAVERNVNRARQDFVSGQIRDANEELRKIEKERSISFGAVGARAGSTEEYQFFRQRQRQQLEARERQRLHQATQAKRQEIIDELAKLNAELEALRREANPLVPI